MTQYDMGELCRDLLDRAEARRVADIERLLKQLLAAEERTAAERDANRTLSRAVVVLKGSLESASATLRTLYMMDDRNEPDIVDRIQSAINDLHTEATAAEALLGITINYGSKP